MERSRWAIKAEAASSAAPAAVTSESKPDSSEPVVLESSTIPIPSYDGAMDEFAQTRPPDDLFDDDFTPMAEPVVEPEPIPQKHVASSVPTAPSASRPRDHPRGRGGGNKRGGAAPHSHSHAQTPTIAPAASPSPNSEPKPAASEARIVKEAPLSAVRGDRSGTGGVKRNKLSEAELADLISSISIKNASRTAAHERAAADAAASEAREAAASIAATQRAQERAHRQKADRQNRAHMMGEREKNRQRKLQAASGREWDTQKEDGFTGTGEERRGPVKRGAYGGVVGQSTPKTDNVEDNTERSTAPQPSLRGRGGSRGGRGRGRGGPGGPESHHQQVDQPPKQQNPPNAADFPELPTAIVPASTSASSQPTNLEFPNKKPAVVQTTVTTSTPSAPSDEPLSKKDSFAGLLSPAEPGKSWADQVESTS